MCVVSMISDHYEDKWRNPFNPQPYKQWPSSPAPIFTPPVTREDFEALKKEVLEMKELLKKAKLYDEKNNEPNCEMEDKIKFLKEVAKSVGVDLEEVFKPK